jgi:hypothetical protein
MTSEADRIIGLYQLYQRHARAWAHDRAIACSKLDDNGFEVVAHMVEDSNCGLHTIWLAQLR